MLRRFSTVANRVRRDTSRPLFPYIGSDGRISIRKHLSNTRSSGVNPLLTYNGMSACLKISFIVSGVSLLGSALVYTALMHPDVQLDKTERQKSIRTNAMKARRFTSHRKLASQKHT